jgi:3-methyladenine DNA glycosylase AlkD
MSHTRFNVLFLQLMEPIQKEIIALLLEAIKTDTPAKFKDLKKYIGTSYDFAGLSTPAQRLIYKTGFSFNNLPIDKQTEVWDKLWKVSNHYEIMTFALTFAGTQLKIQDALTVWNLTKQWVSKVDNWAHSDQLSTIFSELLEKEPEMIYAQYQIWNTSVNPWERRQSLVGLLNYSKLRKVVLPFANLTAMVIPLLKDEDYFVQKGIGWTLREMGNVYPDETLALLTENIAIISPVAFTAAIEKLSTDTKEQLKQLRKAARKK